MARRRNNATAVVQGWAKRSRRRMTAVMRTSAQSVINEAQTPKGKGGNLPLDTGFLRASGQASLDGMPTGPGRLSEGRPDGEDTSLVINRAFPGDTIFFGWTAVYARVQEQKNGFMRRAAMNWRAHVLGAVQEVRARVR